MNISVDDNVYRQIISFDKYKLSGSSGSQGPQGPANFTLVNSQGMTPVNTLGSNSITTTSPNTTYGVNTVESYNTAFLTFKLGSLLSSSSCGFVAVSHLNTFAFGFQFDTINTYSIAANGQGSVGSHNYSNGDLFTIALTSATCKYYQNGVLIYTVTTDTNYLNVFAKFYITGVSNIVNIAFGYLNDSSFSPFTNIISYTWNSGSSTTSGNLHFLNLSADQGTIFMNSSLVNNNSNITLLAGVYSVNVSSNTNFLSSTGYHIYYSTDQSNWTQVGNTIQNNSASVIINLSQNSYAGLASFSIPTSPSQQFYISLFRIA